MYSISELSNKYTSIRMTFIKYLGGVFFSLSKGVNLKIKFFFFMKGSRGSLHASQISHLLLYSALWLLVPASSSQFLPLFLLQPAFEISTGQYYLWEMATRVWILCALGSPDNVRVCTVYVHVHCACEY